MRKSVETHRKMAMRRNAKMRRHRIVIDDREYKIVAETRKELPEYVLDRIDECLMELYSRYPNVKFVQLIGSYSNGTYIDENTEEDFKSLKAGVYRKVKISDFDFHTEPTIIDQFTTTNGYRVHLWMPRDKNEGSLTWEFK